MLAPDLGADKLEEAEGLQADTMVADDEVEDQADKRAVEFGGVRAGTGAAENEGGQAYAGAAAEVGAGYGGPARSACTIRSSRGRR